jgi:hypothetical protein
MLLFPYALLISGGSFGSLVANTLTAGWPCPLLKPAGRILREKYVAATVARYVLSEATDEMQARELATPLLYELYAGTRRKLGRDTPIQIHTVRLTTAEETALWKWHKGDDGRRMMRSITPSDRLIHAAYYRFTNGAAKFVLVR